jgi:hypothetical protein
MSGELIGKGQVIDTEGIVPSAIHQDREDVIKSFKPGESFPQIMDPTALMPGDVLQILNMEKIPKHQLTVLSIHLSPDQDESQRPKNCLPTPHMHAASQKILSLYDLRNNPEVIKRLGVRTLEELQERILTDNWDKVEDDKSITVHSLEAIGLLPLNYDTWNEPGWKPEPNIYARPFLVGLAPTEERLV